jgi:putative transposase
MDTEPELIHNAVAEWASETERVFIPLDQSWRNSFLEPFDRKLRDKCLKVNQLYSLSHAREIIGTWKEEENTIRPYSSFG